MNLLRGDRAVVRIAHRAGALLEAENSLAAIEASSALGVDAVELDVVPAADGRLVLAHGPRVPAEAPSLDEGLDLAARLGLSVQMDVKVRGTERAVADALRRHELLERSFVSSFSRPILRAFASIEPRLPRSLTYPEDRHGLSDRPLVAPAVRAGLAGLRTLLPRRLPRWLRSVEASAATLNAAVVTPRAVEVCHGLGVAVYVWTVNDAALAISLVATGIDGIITDDPRILPGGSTTRS
ncbi:MAG: glycerophosphoryl diester phosphodiesterase [Gaiellaceae bacterium]|nr:glycerophosphoryl diester phosphodiesterase [Gaiellaceae bacterium]